MSFQHYIGIDPGTAGGVAVINRGGTVAWLRRIPQEEQDIWDLIEALPVGGAIVGLEQVSARPARDAYGRTVQGIKSTWTFAQNYGFLRACLVAAELKFVDINPKTWQGGMGLKAPKKESYQQRKKRLKEAAETLFPDFNITMKNCDALLIAEFLRRGGS